MTRDELIELYREQHANAQFRGLTLLRYKHSLGNVLATYQCKTVLDYGSGKGEAWQDWQGEFGLRHVECYDPAVPALAILPPGPFDGVICCDVLEHLVEDDVPNVIEDLFSRARRLVWASVCCRPAKKCFPDGTNMHVTVRPLDWWQDLFAAASKRHGDVSYILKETP